MTLVWIIVVAFFSFLRQCPLLNATGASIWVERHGRIGGQFCVVLCAADYASLQAKYGQPLPNSGGLEAIESIISWGDREAAERIRGSAALYNCGVRVNELCVEVFSRHPHLLHEPASRERLVDICQRLRWMSVQEVDVAFANMRGVNPANVPTEARDLGRPVEPSRSREPSGRLSLTSGTGASVSIPSPHTPTAKRLVSVAITSTPKMGPQDLLHPHGPPKVVMFCLDWSLSMMSQDTGTHLSRFATCQACVQRILTEQVIDHDLVGCVVFGASVETVVPPTPKGLGRGRIGARIASLQAQTLGGTCFFDAVLQCIQQLGLPGLAPMGAPRWLVCLTDGDDLGSRRENARGEQVCKMLEVGMPANLNMIMITVGRLKETNLRVIDCWVDQVTAAGGFARHLSERTATAIQQSFEEVAECLALDVGGATEC